MTDNDGIKETLQQSLAKGEFHEALGLKLVAADQERGLVTIEAPFRQLFERGTGSRQWHGGPIAAIVDIVADFAIFAKLGYGVPTANIRVDFLRPAIDTDLVAHGRVVKVGRTLAVADVEILNQQKKCVATGRGTYITARSE